MHSGCYQKGEGSLIVHFLNYHRTTGITNFLMFQYQQIHIARKGKCEFFTTVCKQDVKTKIYFTILYRYVKL